MKNTYSLPSELSDAMEALAMRSSNKHIHICDGQRVTFTEMLENLENPVYSQLTVLKTGTILR